MSVLVCLVGGLAPQPATALSADATLVVQPAATAVDVEITVLSVPLAGTLVGTDVIGAAGTMDVTLTGLETAAPTLEIVASDLAFGDMAVNLLTSPTLGTADVTSSALGGTLLGPSPPAVGTIAGPSFLFDIAGSVLTLDEGAIVITTTGFASVLMPSTTRVLPTSPLVDAIDPGAIVTLDVVDLGGDVFEFTLTIPVQAAFTLSEVPFANTTALGGTMVLRGTAPVTSPVPVLPGAALGAFLVAGLGVVYGAAVRADAAVPRCRA